jgi:predicted nucleic acid-binding protein
LQTRYVLHTTIIVSWLLDPEKLTGKIVRSLELELFAPYLAVSELWEHRADWSRRRPSFDLLQFTDAIGYYVRIAPPDMYSQEMSEATAVMGRIDPDDSEFIALALKQGAPIWSHDGHFKQQTRVGVVTSRDLLALSPELPTLWEALKDEWSKRQKAAQR